MDCQWLLEKKDEGEIQREGEKGCCIKDYRSQK